MGRQRASSAEIRGSRKLRRETRARLRERQKAAGLEPVVKATLPNRLCQYESEEQEREAREEAVVEEVAVMRGKLPGLLRKLAEIRDPRQPKKIKHKLTCLLLYGILGFVLQVASRREANRELTRPVFRENLLLLFPDLETIPHHDTLNRLLNRIEVEEIQEAQIELVRSLIRKKKFQKNLIEGCYPIAIDGTQKLFTSTLWDAQYLERQVGDEKNKRAQYYIYVAEANLAFSNGMTIPLMTEFLDYEQGDSGREKQDCELRAFYRLVQRLRRAFPRLPIMLLLDGLYPCGPAMQVCIKNKWQFMIVLQDKSLPQVWEEYRGLVKLLEPHERWRRNWGSRRQEFHWVNEIEYDYEAGGRKRRMTVHLVVCQENWEEVDPKTGQIVTKIARHVWLSSRPLSRENVHERCNLGARYRWGIEAGILVEKRCGYHYEHCFAYSWAAMKGYHYLMRIAHLLNVLVQYSSRLAAMVAELGAQGFIRFIRQTLSAPWLDRRRVSELLGRRRQLRLQLAT